MLLLLVFVGDSRAQQLARSSFKNGRAVKKAFRPVVAESRRATVRIRSNGKAVALGAVVDAGGFILTKASALKRPLTCRFTDGRELTARIIGVLDEYDLAMLKVEVEMLPVVQWHAGDDPAVGTWLATPGLGKSPLAVGISSVPRRRIPPQHGVLGILITDSSPGPRITRVFPNSGAENAGLKVDDVITRVAGKLVKDAETLTNMVAAYRPGDTLELSLRRDDRDVAVRATLGHPFSSLLIPAGIQGQLAGPLSRRRADFPAVLQHDSVLRPEDCGGVIVNLSGKAVGLNIARAGRIETLALPAPILLPLLDDLKSGKLAPPRATAELGRKE